jgi:hypothetical protein
MAQLEVLSTAIASRHGGRSTLRVVARRTYTFTLDGRCAVADAQTPLTVRPAYYDPTPSGYPAARADPDLFCAFKTGTDLVVQGSAFSPRGPVARMEVSVALGLAQERVLRRLRVVGDRRVTYGGSAGASRFDEPAPFEVMPLRYDRAYGGRDLVADQRRPDDAMRWFRRYARAPAELLSSHLYARNPAGRGYLVYDDREAVEALALPNIEDPEDLLTPERLCLGHPDAWPRAPVPAGLDWLEQSWFPRIAHTGMCRPYLGRATDFPEVRTGLLPAEAVRVGIERFSLPQPDEGFFHGASPGLSLPTLTGSERIIVSGMHPRADRLVIALPFERPRMLVDPPGAEAAEVEARLRTVIVEPDRQILTTVWAGSVGVQWPIEPLTGRNLRHAVRWIPT